MKKRQSMPLREAWVICFILGVVMLNFPFLHIFNKSETVLGIPLFILYLMIGWPISIGVIYLFSIDLGKDCTTQEHPRETTNKDDREADL